MSHTPHRTLEPQAAEVRGSERVRAVIEVEIERQGDAPVHAWATDLSESGLFLQTTMALQKDDIVSLRFVLQGAKVIIAAARVSRIRPFEPINVTGEMPGAAVTFVEVSALDKARLRRFIRETLPGGSLDDTLPPGLLAQDDDDDTPREATLPLHLAGRQMREERLAQSIAEVNHAASGDVTPRSVARFAEIVTSLPPISEEEPPAVQTWSVLPEETAFDEDSPTNLPSLRPLTLPPVVSSRDASSAIADGAPIEDSTDDLFASLDRELSFEALTTTSPPSAAQEPATNTGTDAPSLTASIEDITPTEQTPVYEEDIDFTQASSWTYEFVSRATPLPSHETSCPSDVFTLTPRHVPTDLPDVRLRTETLPGGPADEVLAFDSELPLMPAPSLDATRPEIPSQKPMLAVVADTDELDTTAKVTRTDVAADQQSHAVVTPLAPMASETGMSVSGLWYAGADEIVERMADGRSLPPGVIFDDGDLNYVASMPPDDAHSHDLDSSMNDSCEFTPLNNRTADHLFQDSSEEDGNWTSEPYLSQSNPSLGEVTPSVLGDVQLSDSEVAFADQLSMDIDDAVSAAPMAVSSGLTSSAKNLRSDALLSEIFGDDSSGRMPSAPLDGESSGAFHLGPVTDDGLRVPADLDRSLRTDEASVFTPALASEMTARIRRRRQAPWKAVAVGAIALGATGLGIGLAFVGDSSESTASASTTPIVTEGPTGTAPAVSEKTVPSVADVEQGLNRTAMAQKAATPKAATPKAATPKAATPKAETPTAVAPVAPAPVAATPKTEPTPSSHVAATPAPKTATSGIKVERGRVTVDLVGGRVVKSFALQNPPRLVVDLEGATLPEVRHHVIGNNGIAKLRFGSPDGKKVRFVVELDRTKSPRDLSVLKRQSSLAVAWK